MTSPALNLTVLRGRYAVYRFAPDAAIPEWVEGEAFTSITRTAQELSIICPESVVPAAIQQQSEYQGGWRVLHFEGTFAFDQTGVLASVATPLATEKIGILALATFDTDYVLVSEEDLPRALDALRTAGHRVRTSQKGSRQEGI